MRYLVTVLITITYLISSAQTIKGKVVRVADGDTITILDSSNTQVRVRLYGIDAPEKGQDFANVAKEFTSDICFSKIVTIDAKILIIMAEL